MATSEYTNHSIKFTLQLKEHLPSIHSGKTTSLKIDRIAFIDAQQLVRVKTRGPKDSYNEIIFNCIFESKRHALDELVVCKFDHLPKEGKSIICQFSLRLLGVDRTVPDTPLAILFGHSSQPECAQLFYPFVPSEDRSSGEIVSENRLLEIRDLPGSLLLLDDEGIEIRQKAPSK